MNNIDSRTVGRKMLRWIQEMTEHEQQCEYMSGSDAFRSKTNSVKNTVIYNFFHCLCHDSVLFHYKSDTFLVCVRVRVYF